VKQARKGEQRCRKESDAKRRCRKNDECRKEKWGEDEKRSKQMESAGGVRVRERVSKLLKARILRVREAQF
jgi:hypothetical protein